MRAACCLVIASLASAVLPGCAWWPGATGGPDQEPDEFPIIWQKAGTYCNRTTPLRLVARNESEMALCPVSDVPVDFKREMVLAAVLGRVTSEGYVIRIRRVYRVGSVLRVDVQIYRPPPTTQPTIQLTCPYHVVVVPRSDLNVQGFSPDPRRAIKTRGAGAFRIP